MSWKKKHIARHCAQFKSENSKKKQKSIDVVSIVSIKEKRNDFIHHMYLMIIVMINKQSMNLRIMMNCDVIKNFIFQLKMKKLNIREFYASVSKFKIFDDITLRTYSSHILLIKIVDQTNHVNFDRHDFIATNIMIIKLILELSWLMS